MQIAKVAHGESATCSFFLIFDLQPSGWRKAIRWPGYAHRRVHNDHQGRTTRRNFFCGLRSYELWTTDSLQKDAQTFNQRTYLYLSLQSYQRLGGWTIEKCSCFCAKMTTRCCFCCHGGPFEWFWKSRYVVSNTSLSSRFCRRSAAMLVSPAFWWHL